MEVGGGGGDRKPATAKILYPLCKLSYVEVPYLTASPSTLARVRGGGKEEKGSDGRKEGGLLEKGTMATLLVEWASSKQL